MISELPRPIHSGKVRDLYQVGNSELLLVASDRMSAFDVVLPTPIPDKGRILTQLSLWWFEQLAEVLPHHVLTADADRYPAPFTGRPELVGRSMLVRRLEMVPVECVARAYLSGSGTAQYLSGGRVSGVPLPAGLVEGDRLPETIFTPTTKGGPTGHDEPMTFAEVAELVGGGLAERLRATTIEVLERGQQVCAPRGILLADTKVEFGLDGAGELVLADEVLTPDSSRFWPAASWRPGRPQVSFDKQPLRDWLARSGWDRQAPGPVLPAEIVEQTRDRYVRAYQQITGQEWH